MGRFFGSLKRLFRGSVGRRQDVEPEPDADVTRKEGDSIGYRYEVKGVLGKGGFGVVYLVYARDLKEKFALKTFRDEYLDDAETRERFRREAEMWADLGRHPCLVWARFVDEASGRLYISMEYIKPKRGLNSLEGYLIFRPPDLVQSLRWAIQFCHGMEYVHSSKDFRCHRDIKPANILISRDMTIKITDLGLAGVLSFSRATPEIKINIHQGRVGLSSCKTKDGAGCGTPTHMPPEQFMNAASCDQRSDIYSFGIVLYQMAAGGQLPFSAPLRKNYSEEEWICYCEEMYRLHREALVPQLSSPLFPIIQQCLAKEPGDRYPTFEELRKDLEPLLKRTTVEVVVPPEPTKSGKFGAKEWLIEGNSLFSLGRYEEAIKCCDKALEIDPRYAVAWYNKGTGLYNLGRYEEAIKCCDKALEINPRLAYALLGKGNSLSALGRYEEAIQHYDKASEILPPDVYAWCYKGSSLNNLGRYEKAIVCLDKALEIDPRHAYALISKGNSLYGLGRYEEAIVCCDKALEIDPRYAEAWYNKAGSEEKLGRGQDAARSYQQFIDLAPDKYPKEIEQARKRVRELGGR